MSHLRYLVVKNSKTENFPFIDLNLITASTNISADSYIHKQAPISPIYIHKAQNIVRYRNTIKKQFPVVYVFLVNTVIQLEADSKSRIRNIFIFCISKGRKRVFRIVWLLSM